MIAPWRDERRMTIPDCGAEWIMDPTGMLRERNSSFN